LAAQSGSSTRSPSGIWWYNASGLRGFTFCPQKRRTSTLPVAARTFSSSQNILLRRGYAMSIADIFHASRGTFQPDDSRTYRSDLDSDSPSLQTAQTALTAKRHEEASGRVSRQTSPASFASSTSLRAATSATSPQIPASLDAGFIRWSNRQVGFATPRDELSYTDMTMAEPQLFS
jgi:hypothetical protein